VRRLKVIHLIGSMDLGGAEKLTRLTIEGLDPGRFEGAVCCLKAGGVYADQLRAAGHPVTVLLNVDKHAGVPPQRLLVAAWRLFRYLRRERPDILHTHLFATSVLGRVIAKLAGTRRIVVTMHRIEYPRLQPWIERLLRPLTDLYITDSHAAAGRLSTALGVPLEQITVIYNGIDRAEFASPPSRSEARRGLEIPRAACVIGVIAHLYEEKGHRFLLHALARVRKPLGDFQLLVVGDGYLRQPLEAEAAQLFPDGNVRFLGQRGDLANLLAAMDLFVLPSSWEGFGIILAEAMYMRVPVITTSDGGGCAEVVAENEGGWRVPYGDETALGEALLRCRADAARLREQGERGRQRVERLFSAEAMALQYMSAYDAVADTREKRP